MVHKAKLTLDYASLHPGYEPRAGRAVTSPHGSPKRGRTGDHGCGTNLFDIEKRRHYSPALF